MPVEEETTRRSPGLVQEVKFYTNKSFTVEHVTLSPARLECERILISLASPIFRLCTKPQPDLPIQQTDEFQTWLGPEGPPILYVHGICGSEQAAEQIYFAAIDHFRGMRQLGQNYQVLYFSFDQWDARRQSITNLVCTICAQIYSICSDSQDLRTILLGFKHGWTERHLLHCLLRSGYSEDGYPFLTRCRQITLVLDQFDHCTEGSQLAFLQWLLQFQDVLKWKVVLTAGTPITMLEKLSATSYNTLELAKLKGFSTDSLDATFENEWKRLIQCRPRLRLQSRYIQQEIDKVKGFSPVTRQLVLEQARSRLEWPDIYSLGAEFSPMVHTIPGLDEDMALTFLLDSSFRRVPDQTMLKRLLSLLLYTTRPISIWELGEALQIAPAHGRTTSVHDDQDPMRHVFYMQDLLAGIIKIQNNEVTIDQRLRKILVPNQSSPRHSPSELQHIWDDIPRIAHHEIARTCLQFLLELDNDNDIQNVIQKGSRPGMLIAQDRTNLCSYALQEWPYHFAQASSIQQADLFEVFVKPQERLMTQLAGGYWALSNQIVRSESRPKTIYSVFAGLGLVNLIEPRDAEDASQGMVEAASRGLERTVRSLLINTYGEPTLLEGLLSATISGNEKFLLYMTEKIILQSKSPAHIPWPARLMTIAAELGYPTLAEKLLEIGVPPPELKVSTPRTTSLDFLHATRNRHAETLEVLTRRSLQTELSGDASRYDPRLLHIAARHGDEKAILFLANVAGLDIEYKAEELVLGDIAGTPLCCACELEQHRAVKVLLELGADPTAGISTSSTTLTATPITIPSSLGNTKCVQLLLQHGANPNMGGQKPPLENAALNGHIETCRLLLQHEADPNNPLLTSPILISLLNAEDCSRGGDATVSALFSLFLQNGANANARDCSGLSILSHVAQRLNGADLCRILLENGADLNLVNDKGLSPLHFAAAHGNVDVAQVLLDNGAKVNQRAVAGDTPLYYALIMSPSGEITALLLEHGAKVDEEYYTPTGRNSNRGTTAIFFAVQLNDTEKAMLLAEHGADLRRKDADGCGLFLVPTITDTHLALLSSYLPRLDLNMVDSTGATVLHLAHRISLNHVKRLVNMGATINVQDNMGYTPLCQVVYRGLLDKADYLLRKGADPNIKPNPFTRGYFGSPIHAASLNRPARFIQLLLDHGAEVDAKSSWGCLPIHYAAFGGMGNFQQILDAGGRVDVRDNPGRTPLHWAAQAGCARVVERVLQLSPHLINVRDVDGWTPLCSAALAPKILSQYFKPPEPDGVDQFVTIEMLLSHDADRSIRVPIAGESCDPLAIAKLCGAPDKVTQLLERETSKVSD
ncbi:ankyrin repeat-containing domain protein [Neurospora tetraspora]|uniref:Ankyrin repeat-containing domain protein n=1 Tax=Neurospora tetraspora TaxID=94610 RepID=A0AAE0MJZ1_9PEZI|nr:ankyrin repeat-containing domain protein [Neurospora tetraspora]